MIVAKGCSGWAMTYEKVITVRGEAQRLFLLGPGEELLRRRLIDPLTQNVGSSKPVGAKVKLLTVATPDRSGAVSRPAELSEKSILKKIQDAGFYSH